MARPNRFVARVETAAGEETVHVKNTGRCRELLIPGVTVYLSRSGNPARKTAFDLIAVEKGNRLINLDAQAPTVKPGRYRLWLSVGRRDGTPEISLPYAGGDSQNRIPLGTIRVISSSRSQ